MKRILCVLIAILMMLSLTVPAFAADEVKSISNQSDLEKLFASGGKGKLEKDLELDLRSLIDIDPNSRKVFNYKTELDLNNFTLTINPKYISEEFKNVIWIFSNGKINVDERFEKIAGANKFSDSIILLDGVEANLSGIFTDESNITLFALNNSTLKTNATYAYRNIYYDANTDISNFNFGCGSIKIDLDGGKFNLESFSEVLFRSGYVFIRSISAQKDKFYFSRWDDNGKAIWTPAKEITFDPGEGTCDTTMLYVNDSGYITEIPVATREGYCFGGWHEMNKNEIVTATYYFSNSTTVYAKWITKEEQIKKIEKPMKDLGFGEDDVQKVISLFSSNNFAGSVIASEPVWGVVIAALIVGAFAGGTVFGRNKNKKD